MSFNDSPLVSVLSPCYNVAPYISRFLDSLISQTYKKLEVILVNDGSTDNTAEIIKKYMPKLEKEGYRVQYIYQENGGLAAAINTGLKYVNGEFFTWPDPDDWLSSDSIEIKLRFLQDNPTAGIVRGNIQPVEDSTGKLLKPFCEPHDGTCLIYEFAQKAMRAETWFAPVAYMVRTSYMDQVIQNREIYVSRKAAQNYQLLIPIALKYECWQISSHYDYYLVRQNSHSRRHKTYKSKIEYIDTNETTLLRTVEPLDCTGKFIQEINKKHALKRLMVANQYGNIFGMWKHGMAAYQLSEYKKYVLFHMFLPSSLYTFLKKLVSRKGL